jgi:hypothetical protein
MLRSCQHKQENVLQEPYAGVRLEAQDFVTIISDWMLLTRRPPLAWEVPPLFLTKLMRGPKSVLRLLRIHLCVCTHYTWAPGSLYSIIEYE